MLPVSAHVPGIRSTLVVIGKRALAPLHCGIENIYFDEKLYLPDIDSIIKCVTAIDNQFNNILIVTHNPGVTSFINSLDCGVSLDDMPTCGMFALTADTKYWGSFVVAKKQFLFFDYPNNFQRDFSKYKADGSGL